MRQTAGHTLEVERRLLDGRDEGEAMILVAGRHRWRLVHGLLLRDHWRLLVRAGVTSSIRMRVVPGLMLALTTR